MIPKPSNIERKEGTYKLTRSIEDEVDTTITESTQQLGDEGYRLEITPDKISITASNPAGAFYGMQSLRQIVHSASAVEGDRLPCSIITDRPHFVWRGLMLDTARHFFSVDYIKRLLDIMALHKLNRFHWHLVEDQGWRIEIKNHPRLVEIGSKRSETPYPDDSNTGDGKPYEGYYTQDQIKGVVAYAAERFIEVIPEIELPGHSLSALAAYPELGCTGGPYRVSTRWSIEENVYCAGNELVFAFLEDVFEEVLELFPSKIIHIGGDECPKNRWKECSKCRQRIKDNSLKDEHELQSYFIKRVERFLNNKGRSIIGWDEILEGGLAPYAAVMSWRGIEGGVEAARARHPVVMSPTSHCYLDYYQGNNKAEPPAIGGNLPLETCYQFDPIPEELSPQEAQFILGGQGNVWTEYIPTPEHAEYMTWPRASALAEVLWSYPKKRNFNDFKQRLIPLLKQMDEMGVNYRKLD